MKKTHILLSIGAATLGALGTVFAQQLIAAPKDADLLQRVTKLSEMTCVTQRPLLMDRAVSMLCAAVSPSAVRRQIVPGVNATTATLAQPSPQPLPPDHRQLVPGDNATFQVYVTPKEAMHMTEEKPSFPVGTVILKQKFSDADAKTTMLFTGMVKREKGYNPACGDWEFFVANGNGTALVARGRIESCMDCHTNYAKTDFVTLQYPVNPVPTIATKPNHATGK